MDLEELKRNWGLLDEQLNQRGQLKEDIIKKMICERGKTSVDRLRKYDLACMYIMLATLILISIPASIYTPAIDIAAITQVRKGIIAFIFIFFILFYWAMARFIGKIDFTESLSQNIRLASRYKMLLIIREGVGILVIIPIIITMCSKAIQTPNPEIITMSVTIIIGLIGGLIFVWKYFKNLGSIFDSFRELKSLKDGKEE